jgi:hypothetical protein
VGDYMQTLVDVEIDDEAAGAMRQPLTSWLIGRGIIAPEVTDCVMGRQGGYAPGANYARAIGYASARRRLWAGARWRHRADPPCYSTNGVSIDVGRQVYWSKELEAVICPRCGHREAMWPRESGRWDTAFDDAFNEWLGGGGGLVACLVCGVGLNDWDWGAPWAFSALGLTFWNWANLSEEFIAEVGEFLGGHRLVYGANKI